MLSHRPGMTCLKRTDREIAQPQIGVAAFFPEPEQRPVQRLAQEVVALAHGNADALAKVAAFDERPARERTAFGGVGTVDPERQRDRVAEDKVDLATPQRQPHRVIWMVQVTLISSHSARARSTLKPAGLPSGPVKLNGG